MSTTERGGRYQSCAGAPLDWLRTEELYRDGELFLKVFFDGDTRLREEVWFNGRMERERSYP